MANPPFNVDGVDKLKDSVKKDPRLVLDGKVNLLKMITPITCGYSIFIITSNLPEGQVL